MIKSTNRFTEIGHGAKTSYDVRSYMSRSLNSLQQDVNTLLRAFSVLHKSCAECQQCRHKEEAHEEIKRILDKHEGEITW